MGIYLSGTGAAMTGPPNAPPPSGVNAMNHLIARTGLFDDFFKDVDEFVCSIYVNQRVFHGT